MEQEKPYIITAEITDKTSKKPLYKINTQVYATNEKDATEKAYVIYRLVFVDCICDIVYVNEIKLSTMETFFLNAIKAENKAVNPYYLAQVYYSKIDEKGRSTPQDLCSHNIFFITYEICRKLARLKLVHEIHLQTSFGYRYNLYISPHVHIPISR